MSDIYEPQAGDEYQISASRRADQLPDGVTVTGLAGFLAVNMMPYNDSSEDTMSGITQALDGRGLVVTATRPGRLAGALVMLDTGMKGFVPPNLLLFVAVEPSLRGRGLGSRLIEAALAESEGGVKLHVEQDNPAKRLYERMGFRPAYIDMRLER